MSQESSFFVRTKWNEQKVNQVYSAKMVLAASHRSFKEVFFPQVALVYRELLPFSLRLPSVQIARQYSLLLQDSRLMLVPSTHPTQRLCILYHVYRPFLQLGDRIRGKGRKLQGAFIKDEKVRALKHLTLLWRQVFEFV